MCERCWTTYAGNSTHTTADGQKRCIDTPVLSALERAAGQILCAKTIARWRQPAVFRRAGPRPNTANGSRSLCFARAFAGLHGLRAGTVSRSVGGAIATLSGEVGHAVDRLTICPPSASANRVEYWPQRTSSQDIHRSWSKDPRVQHRTRRRWRARAMPPMR